MSPPGPRATAGGRRHSPDPRRSGDSRRSRDPRRRLLLLLGALVVLLGAMCVRLAWIQGVHRDPYTAWGASQRLRTVVLPAERGSIFDREGAALALSVSQTTVWADPRLVPDPARAAAALAPVLDADETRLADRLGREGAFVYLARQVDDETAAAVEALDLDGVFFLEEPRRFNPAGDLATSVLGVVGIDNQGLSGLERRYDEVLAGEPGELVREQDPFGRTIAGGVHEVRPARRGDDLVLTLDRSLQFHTERALEEQVAATGAERGVAVLMDPRTGAILALASVEAGGDGPPRPSAANMAVTRVYEPGSVAKLVTVAAALEEGGYTTGTTLSVPDRLPVADHVFRDHERHGVARWSVADIVRVSSNTGTIMIARDLGATTVEEYLARFGFGRPTGLDFPGESDGLVPPRATWSGTSIGSLPIGYGFSATPLQVLGAYNAIANAGVLVEPQLVSAAIDREGRERPAPRPRRERVVSAETARELTGVLVDVVRSGTAPLARIDGYTVAGKTGTARKPLLDRRGYEPGAYLSTFVGFVPAEDPRLSAIVVLDEPTPIYAGLVAAPVFAEVVEYAVRHLRIPPHHGSRAPDEVAATLPWSAEYPPSRP